MASRSRKRVSDASDDFIVDDEPPRVKKSKTGAAAHSKTTGSRNTHGSATRKVDTNGDTYWEISKMRRVTISSFRGKTLVNIREYYEKGGQELPGKKGISMPIDQFSTFMTLLPDIEKVLRENGESIPRPSYIGQGKLSEENEEREDSTDELSGTHPPRKNIEATSDEEESEE